MKNATFPMYSPGETPGQSHEGVSEPKKGLSAALRGAKNRIGILSQGCAALHPGLCSHLPYGKNAIDPLDTFSGYIQTNISPGRLRLIPLFGSGQNRLEEQRTFIRLPGGEPAFFNFPFSAFLNFSF
jgi:hypothetical protein